ncbi:putative glutathione S-transferase [Rosellinia necatrix]|uniref:Putative glutathione S-transferase n=1 Tax=Rosellinia necatrix TaxID=77044 RepID=A0A1W2TNQ6_ROSNE|nr:putative glutathione S-transferase [Rosellinia necatrix]
MLCSWYHESRNLDINPCRRLEKSRAQNILWLLEELKVDYEIKTFRRGSDMLAPPELKKIHPLGKSPLVSITPSGPSSEPIILAESGFITQYLSEHFGQETTMAPKRWRDGQEGKAGSETVEWMRWQYTLHFVEGSFMSTLMMAVVIGMLKSNKIPFFIRPITSMVANQILTSFVLPNLKTQLAFLEKQLETSEGDFLCGKNLTSADVLLSFGLVSVKDKVAEFGSWPVGGPKAVYPKLYAYIDRLQSEPGYKNAVAKINEIDSSLGVDF